MGARQIYGDKMRKRKTEALVRKVFCQECRIKNLGCFVQCGAAKAFLRMARRFVRLEQAEKHKAIWRKFHKECADANSGQTNQEVERMEENAGLYRNIIEGGRRV